MRHERSRTRRPVHRPSLLDPAACVPDDRHASHDAGLKTANLTPLSPGLSMNRHLCSALCTAVCLTALAAEGRCAPPETRAWKAGVASVVITPEKELWMAGYAS